MRPRSLGALRRLAPFALLALSAVCSAQINYTVKVQPDEKNLAITMAVPVRASETELKFQMPRWAPGSYRYANPAKLEPKATFVDAGANTELEVTHPDETTWVVKPPKAEGMVTFTYSIPATPESEVIHWSGPSTYAYVIGRLNDPVRLRVEAPEDWQVAVGLNPAQGEGGEFVAPDYDTFADNPVTVGKFVQDTYTVLGKPHYLVYRGPAVAEVDREAVKKMAKFVTETQADFFGGLPYDRYVWHFVTFDAADGGWGLEHLTSTQIGLSSGFGPGIQGVLSHEFFHLWNVKRIRSKPLGPFNYQELPQTGALWWLEGVTDYYAHMLLRRYGWTDDKRFGDVLARTISRVRQDEDRLKVSPYEASYRVRDAAGGRGNSQGFGLSYYDLGFIVGALLDVELRDRSKGRYSLDDVTRALYDLTKDGKPGFEEDEIRKQLVKFGGAGMGDYYDKVVMQAGELPVEETLAKAGLALKEVEVPTVDLGFEWAARSRNNAVSVRSSKDPNVLEGDLILAVDGVSLQDLTNRRLSEVTNEKLRKAEVGKPLTLKVKREDKEVEVVVTPKAGTAKQWSVVVMPDASSSATALRKAWLTPPATWKPTN